MKILVFSSVGGHFRQASEVISGVGPGCEVHFVVNGTVYQTRNPAFYWYQVDGAGRNLKQSLVLMQCVFIFFKVRPDCFFSTGAAPAVWFVALSRICGIKSIFLESWARQRSLSLTGKICKKLGCEVFVQNADLARETECVFWNPFEN